MPAWAARAHWADTRMEEEQRMNQTMKAAVVHAFGQPLRIEEVKTPLPGPGQILVKIEASRCV